MSKSSNCGGKRQGSGRPRRPRFLLSTPPKKIFLGEPTRIYAIRNVLNGFEGLVKPYKDKEAKGDYELVIRFLNEVNESDAKFDNVKKEKPDFLW